MREPLVKCALEHPMYWAHRRARDSLMTTVTKPTNAPATAAALEARVEARVVHDPLAARG